MVSLAYSCVFALTAYTLLVPAYACGGCLCLPSNTSLALSSRPSPVLSGPSTYHPSPLPFSSFSLSSTVLLLTVDPISFFVFITREKGTKTKARPGVQVFFFEIRTGKKRERESEKEREEK